MAHTLDYKERPSYNTYERRARKNFPNDNMISKDEFINITTKECYYCGREGPNGIDRIDNEIGYQSDNCVPCCKHCNYVKGNLSNEDFNTWKNRFVKKQSVQE
jgi:hypothetical protein